VPGRIARLRGGFKRCRCLRQPRRFLVSGRAGFPWSLSNWASIPPTVGFGRCSTPVRVQQRVVCRGACRRGLCYCWRRLRVAQPPPSPPIEERILALRGMWSGERGGVVSDTENHGVSAAASRCRVLQWFSSSACPIGAG
jgi:hypothetical protein